MSWARVKDKGFGFEVSPDRHLRHVSHSPTSLLPLLMPFLRPIIGEPAQVGARTDMLALQAEVEAFLRARVL